MKRIILLASMVSSLAVSAQTVTKKVTLTKGQQLEQSSQAKVNIVQEMMGQSMEIKMESSSINLVEVKEDNGSGFSVSNTLKKVLMNMNAMGQEMKFDSDKKEDMDGKMGDAYRDRLNKPKEFTVGKDGIISKVNEESKANDPNAAIGEMLAGNDEKAGAPFFALANIPTGGAKVGESWVDSTVKDGSRTVNRYTLRQVNGAEGIVDVNSDLSMSRQVEQQGMTMQMDLKGTAVGEYNFDVNTGLVKSRKTLTKATGTIDVMGQTVPLTLESNITSTLTKK